MAGKGVLQDPEYVIEPKTPFLVFAVVFTLFQCF